MTEQELHALPLVMQRDYIASAIQAIATNCAITDRVTVDGEVRCKFRLTFMFDGQCQIIEQGFAVDLSKVFPDTGQAIDVQTFADRFASATVDRISKSIGFMFTDDDYQPMLVLKTYFPRLAQMINEGNEIIVD